MLRRLCAGTSCIRPSVHPLLCNFTIFLFEKGREKRRQARERVTSDRQQKRDAEENESAVGEKDTVQSVCLEIEEGETTVHVAH